MPAEPPRNRSSAQQSRATTITYLEMHRWDRPAPGIPAEVTIERLVTPSVSLYRQLYNGVGRDYDWHERNRLSDSELQQLICRPDVIVHLLRVGGELAGYSELRATLPADVELVYFGLFPQFIGRGLGRFFLDWTIDFAWSLGPERVWLHTCDKDHRAALPNYLRAGFQIYARRTSSG
jgi:GNAT superfamily N-acetyltransferase